MVRQSRPPIIPPLEKGGRGDLESELTPNTRMENYKKKLKTPARSLRSNMTDAEQALWYRIRRKQVQGLQFYRQKTLLSFIVDFYCPAAKLVIEIDGSQHLETKNLEKDRARDAALMRLGLLVLRFDNRQVLTEGGAVLAAIDEAASMRKTGRGHQKYE